MTSRTSLSAAGDEPGDASAEAPGIADSSAAVAEPINDTYMEEAEVEEKNEVWENFGKSFEEVQAVLEQNRLLIQQVNENQQSRISDYIKNNVALIRQINENITKVAALYSHLNSDFRSSFHRNRRAGGSRDDGSGGGQAS